MNTDANKTNAQVLCWPKRLLSAEDLRRHLTIQRELELLPKTVVTPLALDELKAKGVRLVWRVPTQKIATESEPASGMWAFALENANAIVSAAVQALEREGLRLTPLSIQGATPWTWASDIALSIAEGKHVGAVIFCGDPSLVCCVANKISGVRAASVWTVVQATRARQTLAANLLAVEVPGRTMYEIRQILKTAATLTTGCQSPLAEKLKELDGHAHR